MRDGPATFSESWYRVAGQRLCLRSSVNVQRQYYRGERWYVLQDPLRNQFFRLRPAAYEFVARLRPDRTVEEVWRECLNLFPDEAPGQEAVIQLLAQLYHANLLQYDVASDTAQLFKRYQKTRQRELRARLTNIMFMRFPLLDPDDFLVRAMPVARKLISPFGALVWLAVVGAGLKVVADNFPALREQAQGIIAPNNLLLLYASLVLLKTIHEFGHAFICRRFGGEVHAMGILFMIFTPIPYMDATSAWGFRERWKRVLVGASGMLVEVFVAALAALVWARTGQGTIHSLAYNLMFIASVSTIVFNLNPLLRFDGYYILSDLIGMPNLSQRAIGLLRYYAERYLYGLKKEEHPASSTREAAWLVAYGISSSIYRVIVFGGILLIVADRFLLIGILMAAVCAVAWVAVPVVRLIAYLASSPKLERNRLRAVVATATVLAIGFLLLQVVPLPHHFRAPGIVQSGQWSEVRNETAGVLARLVARPGTHVGHDEPLLELVNPELEFQLTATRARQAEVQARIRQALLEAIPNLEPLNRLAETAAMEIHRLEVDRSNLVVRTRHAGIWVAPGLEHSVGRWLARGTELGLTVGTNGFHFRAIVRQEDGDRLFENRLARAQVRLRGQAGRALDTTRFQVIPGDLRSLPSAALGWLAGGPVATLPTDQQGIQAAEPFFEVRTELADAGSGLLLHGESGQIRFDLPSEPLLPRWARSLRQLLQKRYQL